MSRGLVARKATELAELEAQRRDRRRAADFWAAWCAVFVGEMHAQHINSQCMMCTKCAQVVTGACPGVLMIDGCPKTLHVLPPFLPLDPQTQSESNSLPV